MKRRWIAASVTVGLIASAAIAGLAHATGSGGWDHLGHGATATTASLNGAVYALNTDNAGVLYVGGSFTDAGGLAAADYIAKWDGTTWSAVNSGASQLNGAVNAIAYSGGNVYAGGTFTNAGGDAKADFAAVWNGTAWSSLCSSGTQLVTSTVSALQIIGSTLYVGGGFANGGGISSADRLVACDLGTGVATSTIVNALNEFNGTGVYAMAKDSNNALYVAGGFLNLDGIAAADHVAYLDGGGWHAMGSGGGSCGCAVDSIARSITTFGTTVYVGTDSKDIGGIAQADNVARWNGSVWSALGSDTATTDGWFPTPTVINGLYSDGTNVYAAGTFVNANGDPKADEIAEFDGSSWHSLGNNGTNDGPLPQPGDAVTFFGGRLHVGGLFTTAGNDLLAHGIARYPGYLPDCNPVIINGATGGIPLKIHLSCSDQSGIPVQFQIRSSPSHGSLGSVSGLGNVTYTSTVGYQGSDSFTYGATNSDGDSTTKTVTIAVANRGYSQSAQNIAISHSLKAGSDGTVKIPVRNKNTFAVTETRVTATWKSHGAFGSSASATKIGAGKNAKLSLRLKPSKLKLLKRLGHVSVTITVKFAGPQHSHSTGTSNGTLRAP